MQIRELTALGTSLLIHALFFGAFAFIKQSKTASQKQNIPFVQVDYIYKTGKSTPLSKSIESANKKPSKESSESKADVEKVKSEVAETPKPEVKPVEPSANKLSKREAKQLWTKVILGSRTLDRSTRRLPSSRTRAGQNARLTLKEEAIALNANVDRLPAPVNSAERGDLRVIQRRIQSALTASESVTTAAPTPPLVAAYTRASLLTNAANLARQVRRFSAANTRRGRNQRAEALAEARQIQEKLNALPTSRLRVERSRARQIEQNLAVVLRSVNAPATPAVTANSANTTRANLLRTSNTLARTARNLAAATTQRGRTQRADLARQANALQAEYRRLPATNRRAERADNRTIERNIQNALAASRLPATPTREQLAQAEAARQAEANRQTEARRQREDASRTETARQAETRRQREEAARAEAARLAENRRQTESTRQAEATRQREAAQRAEAARAAEARRVAEEEAERRRRAAAAPPPTPPRPTRMTSSASVSGQLSGRAIVNRAVPQNSMGANAVIEVIVSVSPSGEVVSHSFVRRGNAEAEAAVARVVRNWRFERLGRAETGNQSGRIIFRFVTE